MNATYVNHTGQMYAATGKLSPINTLSGQILSIFKDMGKLLRTWQGRVEYRQHLLDLDERLLRDIGLSRYDALKEAAKPFWKD